MQFTRKEFLAVLEEKIHELQDKAGKMAAEMGNASNQDVNTQMELQGQIFAHQETAAAYEWCRQQVEAGFTDEAQKPTPAPDREHRPPRFPMRDDQVMVKLDYLEGKVEFLENIFRSLGGAFKK